MTLQKLKNIACYALYDAGNSNYVTLIPAIIFPVYLKTVLMQNSRFGAITFGACITMATLLAAFLGPNLGEYADRNGRKFAALRWTSLAAIAGVALMPFLGAGMFAAVVALFVATETCYLLATVMYDSALSDVAEADESAGISSFAWGVGYAGGVIGLVVALRLWTEDGFGFTRIFLVAAGLWLLFGLPLILVKDKARKRAEAPLRSFRDTIRDFLRDKLRVRFLLAFFLYTNGVSAVIYFTGSFARDVFNLKMPDLLLLFIAMNAVAAPASLAFGKVAERWGHIRTLRFVVLGWIVAVIGVILSDQNAFVVVSCGAAALLGPVQALSRSLFRIIFPEDSMSSYFGVQAMAARGSALVGPLLYGALASITDNARMGAVSAALLFAGGFVALLTIPVDAERASIAKKS